MLALSKEGKLAAADIHRLPPGPTSLLPSKCESDQWEAIITAVAHTASLAHIHLENCQIGATDYRNFSSMICKLKKLRYHLKKTPQPNVRSEFSSI